MDNAIPASALHLRSEIDYELDPKPLGTGGFSVVHRAWEPGLGRWVALKVIAISKVMREMGISREEIEERHRTEIRACGRLRHDHIVEVYNYGRGEDRLWHAMTLLPGGSILSRIRPASGKNPIPADPQHIIHWLEILIRVCRTVGFCHGQGVLHRDLKHDNILFDEHDRPTVTDFGMARLGEPGEGDAPFAGGDQVYSAPELLAGEAQDDRTDVYSLGCICHFALTAREPFAYGDAWSAHHRDARVALKRAVRPDLRPGELDDFHLPQEQNPALREDLARVVLRAMSGDPAQRHRQPRHLADALQEQLDIERTLHRVATQEFIAERAAPLITAFLRRDGAELDEATLLGAGQPGVDVETRRQHLAELVRRGIVVERHQAYSLARRLDLRHGKRRREKQAIGEFVARLVTAMPPPVGLSVDGGSTTNEVIRALLRMPAEQRERVSALRTNNTCWVWDAMGKTLPPGWRLVGGWIRPESLATLGPGVADQFRAFSPAAAVVGVMGLVAEANDEGLLVFSVDTDEEAALKKMILKNAHLLSVLVFDSSKFGVGAGETIIKLRELVHMAQDNRQRRIVLVTSHPSVHSHTGPGAPERVEADRRRFVEHLRDLLRRLIERKGDRHVTLTLAPVSLTCAVSKAPLTLPVPGESVDNLPYAFTRPLAEMTALPEEHEVVVSIEL